MSNTSTQFQNDNIQVTMERGAGCQVKLDIFVTPKASQAAYAKAIKIVNKEVSLPGFRKGRAPDAMVVQNYGKYVDKEWHDVLVQTAFSDALALINTYPFSKESVQRPQVKKASKEEGSSISIAFEATPVIPTVNPMHLKLNPVSKEPVADRDVDNYIENMRLNFSQWEDIADRPVQEGDYVDLDIDSLDEPGLNICSNTRFLVQEGIMSHWMRNLVLGLTANQSAEGVSEKEEEASHGAEPEKGEGAHTLHHSSKGEFKPTRCRITVKAIKTAVKPELDDELAKKVGAVSVADMREKVRAELDRRADETVQDSLKRQVEEQLTEQFDFEIPASLIEHEKQFRVQQKMTGMDLSKLSREEVSQILQKVEKEIGDKIEHEFRLFFLMRKVAEDNHIHVLQEEIIQELMRHMWLNKNQYESLIDESMDPNEVKSRIYVNVLTQKALAYLVEHAQK